MDFDHFVPEFERFASLHGKLRVLFDLTGFHGWEAGALWDEIQFDIKHYADIERLAVVGDRKWQQGMAAFFKPFTKATSRYFDHADAAEARKWLDETPRPTARPAQANARALIETARMLVADDKGLLAMDESNPTCNKRFAELGIPQTEKARRAYRELIVTTPGLGECISGVILYDETIRQSHEGWHALRRGYCQGRHRYRHQSRYRRERHGRSSPERRSPRASMDCATASRTYFQMGARFAKWRAVIALGAEMPSRGCIEANAQALARYAALCQEAGLVPVVEPEVLMDGDHTLEQCRQVTEEVLRTVFVQLCAQRVMLEGMILKPNMVLPGLACLRQEAVDEVADVTVKCLLRTVPAAVPGIAFLSGGQSGELASARLNAMNVRFKSRLPWAVAFSFARAIQQPALEIWRGEEAHVPAAQRALYHRAACNRAARRGEYTAAMENAGASQPVPAQCETCGIAKDRKNSHDGTQSQT